MPRPDQTRVRQTQFFQEKRGALRRDDGVKTRDVVATQQQRIGFVAHDATTCNPDALKSTKPQAAIVMELRVGRVFVSEPEDTNNLRRCCADYNHLDEIG